MSNGFRFSFGALIGSVVFSAVVAAVAAAIAGAVQGIPVQVSIAAGGPFDACVKNGFSGGAVVGLIAYLAGTAYAVAAEVMRPDAASVWRAVKAFTFAMIFASVGSGVFMAILTVHFGGTHWLKWL